MKKNLLFALAFALGLSVVTGAQSFFAAKVCGDAAFLQCHIVPAVAADTFALIGATQTLVGKTLTAPIETGPILSVGANGAALNNAVAVTELTTIAAAASTATAIQIPAGAVVLAVTVRVTVAIPTAATFTVKGTTTTTTFNAVAGVPVALNTTDVGTAAGAFYNAAAQTITITPNLTPATNVGRVRVTAIYYTITPATS